MLKLNREPEKIDPEVIRELEQKNPDTLSRKEKKILRKAEVREADEKYRETEIRFGIRTKILILVISILVGAVTASYFISVNNQTESLEQQLVNKGVIITTALKNSIKAKINDRVDLLTGLLSEEYKSFSTREQYRNFYQEKDLAGTVFEFVQSQRDIDGDLVYVVVMGKENIIWSDVHTRKDLDNRRMVLGQPYYKPLETFDFKNQPGVNTYLSEYGRRGLKKPTPLVQEFESKLFNTDAKKLPGWDSPKSKKPGETEGIIDISDIITLGRADKASVDKAVGEIHVGISRTSVEREIDNTIFALSLTAFISVLSGVILSVLASALLAKPIMAMTTGMQRVSEGDFSAAVKINSSDEVGRLSNVFNRMLNGMSILVSPEVAKVVLNTEDLYTSSESRDVTVLFSDIRSFTTLSESLTPREVVMMLNDYLDLMTNIIVKYGGVVDKFVGDEIFSCFGAPYDHKNHPLAACAVALEMGVTLARHNSERVAEGKPPINIGIGINTGPVIAGAMGSKKRVDYTSIGDAVNLGARLEGTNKIYGTLTIMSEFTYAHVKDWVICRELDSIKVKGKNKPVTIYEVVGLTEEGHELAAELILPPEELKQKLGEQAAREMSEIMT